LPKRFGKWNSVFQRFNRWSKKGVWQKVFEALQAPDLDWLLVDSTIVRAHQPAAGQKKYRQTDQAVGRSRGGYSSKIHEGVNTFGNPRRVMPSGGPLPTVADQFYKLV